MKKDRIVKSEMWEKNKKSDKFYEVTDTYIAEELIKLNKYLYFTEMRPHWQFKDKIMRTYCFEFSSEIFEDVAKIKKKRGGNNATIR